MAEKELKDYFNLDDFGIENWAILSLLGVVSEGYAEQIIDWALDADGFHWLNEDLKTAYSDEFFEYAFSRWLISYDVAKKPWEALEYSGLKEKIDLIKKYAQEVFNED